jgi:glutathione S-transferase
MIKLFLVKGCPFAHRAWICLREKNIAFEPIFFERAKRPPELESLSPRAKSPTVFDGDAKIYDSNAVVEYIGERYPEPRLMPVDPIARAQVRMIAAAVGDELMPKFGALAIAALFAATPDPAKIATAKRAILDALPSWNEALAGRTFLVGEELTLADVTLYTPFRSALVDFDTDIPNDLTHLRAWRDRVASRPSTEYP